MLLMYVSFPMTQTYSSQLKKFQLKEKDNTDEKDELLKKKTKEPTNRAGATASSGETALALADVSAVRGARDGGRGRRRTECSESRRPPRNTGGGSDQPQQGRGQGGNRGRGGPG